MTNHSLTYGQHKALLRKEKRHKDLADFIAGGMMLAMLVLAIIS